MLADDWRAALKGISIYNSYVVTHQSRVPTVLWPNIITFFYLFNIILHSVDGICDMLALLRIGDFKTVEEPTLHHQRNNLVKLKSSKVSNCR